MMTFTDYLKTQYHYSEKTLLEKEKQLENWQKMCGNYQNLSTLNKTELFKIIEIQRKKYKETTLNYLLKTLEQYYFYQIKTGKRTDNPLKDFRIKTPKKPLLKGFLNEEELNEIYQKMPVKGHYSGQFDGFAMRKKIIVGLLVYQGLCTSDFGEIDLQDIDLKSGTIEISKKQSSRLNGRKLVLSPNQIIDLQQYTEKTRGEIMQILKQENSEKLFPFSEKSGVKSLTKTIKTSIGKHVQITHLQQIRYSRIALWLKVFNPREVQYKAGYKSLLSLEKFQQDRLESLKQAIEKHHIF